MILLKTVRHETLSLDIKKIIVFSFVKIYLRIAIMSVTCKSQINSSDYNNRNNNKKWKPLQFKKMEEYITN